MKSYKLKLTALGPAHIGTGADYEPTNYVIDIYIEQRRKTAALRKLNRCLSLMRWIFLTRLTKTTDKSSSE
ncbi:MAG: hypothetical protein LBI57_00365 [Helicobacteraceae bacterium]|jgi:hypothetical protein|nr:hypothetical protein [Helicobacteraceae bacterium]